MPTGSIFSKFDKIELTTADDTKISIKNDIFKRIGLMLFGLPHIGMRLRARKLINNFPRRKINRMLDAGFGSGIYSFTFHSKVKNIDSVDIANEKVDYVKSVNFYKNINFQQGDLCKLKFKDNSFDLIICSDVLEHIKKDEQAFSEISRVLAKNGDLLITVPYKSKSNERFYKKFGHERVGYSREDMERLCKKNNLTLLKSEGYAFPLTEKLFHYHYKFIKSNVILALMFYPFYALSILADRFSTGEPNGIFFKIKKI